MLTSGSTQQIVPLYFYGVLIIIHHSTRNHITVNSSFDITHLPKTINSHSIFLMLFIWLPSGDLDL